MSEQNQHTNSYYNELAHKWLTGTITAGEKLLLEQWYSQGQDAAVTIPAELAASETEHETLLLQKIEQRIAAEGVPAPVRTMQFRRLWWVAASVLLLVSAGGLLWKTQLRSGTADTAKVRVVQDVAPGKAGAILTLADGRSLMLDSMHDGVITLQQGAEAALRSGKLDYRAIGNAAAGGNNTITTPRGRQFTIVLEDGTTVWLNAASSLTFPTAFTGAERVVSITGEAYFEVAKTGNAAANRPFKVKVNNQAEVQVLGTRFNVNAYADEAGIQTTLLEGAVRVNTATRSQLLKPGQQAVIKSAGAAIALVTDADTEQAVAWKNGKFYFNRRTGVEELMRQLSRWYDVEVVYENGIPNAVFTGEMERDLSLKQIIKGLDGMGVTFTIEGRKLLVQSR